MFDMRKHLKCKFPLHFYICASTGWIAFGFDWILPVTLRSVEYPHWEMADISVWRLAYRTTSLTKAAPIESQPLHPILRSFNILFWVTWLHIANTDHPERISTLLSMVVSRVETLTFSKRISLHYSPFWLCASVTLQRQIGFTFRVTERSFVLPK